MNKKLPKTGVAAQPNKWVGSDKIGIWEYGYYRYTLLTIRRLENGKYKPMVGAIGELDFPGFPLPENKQFEYNTFKEAETHCFKYIDWIKDVWDAKSKRMLQSHLHYSHPDVYPKPKKVLNSVNS